jgi:hypothetical protein
VCRALYREIELKTSSLSSSSSSGGQSPACGIAAISHVFLGFQAFYNLFRINDEVNTDMFRDSCGEI